VPVLLTLVPILGGLLLAYLVWNWKFRRRD
jgi:threonine/homoserine/homoserine lactone efflux protein